jgi:hypothetical protein
MNKYLTESGWKATLQQTKGKVKDNGLQKALATYEKLHEEKYPEREEALERISKLAKALNNPKGNAGIDAVKDYLGNVSESAAREEVVIEKAKKGAAAAAKDSAPTATVKTPFGGIAYFTTDKANSMAIERLEKAVETLAGAQDDVKAMNMAHQEADKIKKEIPPIKEIIESVKKADRASADEARQAKAAYLLLDEFSDKAGEVKQDAENAAEAAKAAVMELDADNLEEKAKELRKEAEEIKSAIEKFLKTVTTVLKVTVAAASPDPLSKLELASTVADTLESAVSIFGSGTGGLIAQAEEDEKKAHELKLEAAAVRMKQTKSHMEALQQRLVKALDLYKRAKVLVQQTGKAPMKGFDQATKGKFHFEKLEAYADKLAETCDLAVDAIKGSKLVFDIADVTLGVVTTGKWKLPQPDDTKKILNKMKDAGVKLGKYAGETYKGANMMRITAQKEYAEAQEALAQVNS